MRKILIFYQKESGFSSDSCIYYNQIQHLTFVWKTMRYLWILTLLFLPYSTLFASESDSLFNENREAFQKEVEKFHATHKPRRVEFNEGPTQSEMRDNQVTPLEKRIFQNREVVVNEKIHKEHHTEFQLLRLDWGVLGDAGGKSFRFASSMGFLNPALNYRSKTSHYSPENFFKRRRTLISANPFLGFVKERRKHSNTIFRMVQLGMGIQITSKHHKWNSRLSFLKGKEDQLRTVNGYAVSTSFLPMHKGVGLELTYSEFRKTAALSLSLIVEVSDLIGMAVQKGKAHVAAREAVASNQ